MFQLARSTDREGPKDEGTVGLYQDYYGLPNGGFLRGGYQFIFSVGDASYRESRIVTEAIAAAVAPYSSQFANRARLELRWVNDAYSWRFRDRVRLLRATRGIRGQPLSPYVTFEAYYDSRYRSIARLAGRIGTELPFSKRRRLDIYWARQNNSRDSPPRVNALGMTLALTY